MPKIPQKPRRGGRQVTKSLPEDPQVPMRELADHLARAESLLLQAREEVTTAWKALYTCGLSERGPIAEGDDDIPF